MQDIGWEVVKEKENVTYDSNIKGQYELAKVG